MTLRQWTQLLAQVLASLEAEDEYLLEMPLERLASQGASPSQEVDLDEDLFDLIAADLVESRL